MVSLNVEQLSEYPAQKNLKRLTIISLVMMIITWVLMTIATLKNTTIYNVMSLEFAWSVQQMDLILQTWGNEIIQGELVGTIFDFGFLVSYSVFIACITLMITRKVLPEPKQRMGYYLTVVPFVAALFDAIENINLLLMLSSPGSYPEFSPFMASLFASMKFTLLIIVILFDIIVLIWCKVLKKK
ncbi:MAG: hypothetical protein ACTSW1_19025 [Candidatus Hodarchaeales archaeon]